MTYYPSFRAEIIAFQSVEAAKERSFAYSQKLAADVAIKESRYGFNWEGVQYTLVPLSDCLTQDNVVHITKYIPKDESSK